MKSKLPGGTVYKIDAEPDATACLGLHHGRIRMAEINLPETVIQHTQKQLLRLYVTLTIRNVMQLKVGDGYLLNKVREDHWFLSTQ